MERTEPASECAARRVLRKFHALVGNDRIVELTNQIYIKKSFGRIYKKIPSIQAAK